MGQLDRERVIVLEENLSLMQRKLDEQKRVIEAHKEHIAILRDFLEVKEDRPDYYSPLREFMNWLARVKG